MKKLISIVIAAILLFGCFETALAAGTAGGEYGWRQGDGRWCLGGSRLILRLRLGRALAAGCSAHDD